ncbi:LPS export ABC transporter permease LptF [Stappia sp. ES.058]|uniref:LPS export ABC transporter permease LptF n=1 Tax=Stappia sp. ES.058 TaxID=1881061 RepID=UPI00087ACB85|nr:LPS export ABC transporter permease LptF [Stappia sp. ES.058]SDU16617.1 lipopolysaccharide export system permease protein [Stappia sp. ES.058]
MTTFERYVLRRLTAAFALTLAALAGVVWATQALRQLDLVTSKGQTIIQFVGMTLLAMPFLLLAIAPFALLIALIVVLNTLSNDSELIVINASGASRTVLMRPVISFAIMVSLFCATLSLSLAPLGLSTLRDEITRVRVDLVANIVRPGRFIGIEDGLTFHIRNRSGDGQLDGLLMHDDRAEDTVFTYEAARGRIVEAAGRTLLVMQDGTIQRRTRATGSISIVRFQSYAFDLSNMVPTGRTSIYKASERSLMDLLAPSADDTYARDNRARLVAELHDRLSQPLYPLAFALIVFVFAGQPKTTRQNRNFATLSALTLAILLRSAGFGVLTLVPDMPSARFALYALPLAAILLCSWAIAAERRPSWIKRLIDALELFAERIEGRLQKLRGRHPNGVA